MRRLARYIHCLGILLVLSLAGLTIAPPQAAMAAPEISISPSEGRIGTSVDVQGSGFALVSGVQITFGGVPVDNTMTVLGAFEASFDVPPSQPGQVTVTATDNAGNSASAEFTVANDAPVAQDTQLSVDEDASTEIVLAASDPNDDSLTFAIGNDPHHGTLQSFDPASGRVIYVPEQDYSGSDSFDFTVSDGTDEDAATVSIVVEAINDLPVAEPQSVSVDEGRQVAVTLEGSDPEGSELTFSISQQPAHGTLSGEAPQLTYAPANGYSGADVFEFVVHDGEESSAPAAVQITVTPVNSAPTAGDVEVETEEDEPVTVYLSANDADSQQVSFEIESTPSHGSLGDIQQTGPTSATITYRPHGNYHGADSFTFVADDGEAESGSATVEIEVEPVNDAPEVRSQSVTVQAGEQIEITLAGDDVDGDELEFFIAGDADRGRLGAVSSDSDESAVVTYTPDPDEHGQDSFTFRASDGDLQSNTGTVAITVLSPPAPAQAEQDTPPAQVQDQAPPPGGADQGDSAPPPAGNTAQDDAAAGDETATEVPAPEVTPEDIAQGAAMQSLSAGAAGSGASANSAAVWLIPGALVGIASVVAFLGYREKSLKGGLLLIREKLLAFAVALGLAKAVQSSPGRPVGGLAFSVPMNRIYRILNDDSGRMARKRIFDVQYSGVRADPQEYEASKALAKKQFEQIGSILRSNPELQEPFFDSFGEITVKVWWAIKEDVSLDGRKGMRWESLEWLGSETEKYWARQSGSQAS